ncbi:virulence factor TspB C-terminal domain-related protein [Acinetobacter oleivorans]|uniref:virulence factor TspB C-terminal domain-related protein n=1 Tax=Acinetobacter oleivorans TaxID=1148157 RepID=UPI0030166494
MVHRFNIFLLSILLVFSQIIVINQAIASTVANDGWSITKRLVQGATTFYDGTKNVVLNGKNYAAKGTAAITPTASQVSKMIVRTGAVLAVDLAIKALLGGVDYVMDSANNRVKYQAPGEIGVWMVVGVTYENMTIDQACAAARSSYIRHDSSFCYYGTVDPDTGEENLQATWGYALVSSTTKEEKYLPYDAVAAQIIGDAAGKEDAKAYVSSVADTASEADPQRQIIPISEIVNQLNQSQSISTSNTATGSATPTTGTGTGDPTTSQPAPSDIALDFPEFCGWAPTVCQAAQAAIDFPKTVQDWYEASKKSISDAWADAKEWMNTEDTPTETTEVEIDKTPPQVPNTSYFNWGAYCPFTPGSQTISLGDTSASLDYDLSSWCELATDLRPFVLAAGALMSFLIASGIIMGRED